MQIIKTEIDSKTVRIDIGAEFKDDTNKVVGLIELDIENQGQFIEIVNSILDEGLINIIFDMKLVNYIDSSGLWALFEGYKKAAQKEGKLVLLQPTKDVKRVLDITKMSSKIEIYGTEEDALKAINQ